ncbi:MAG: CAP domain-containing protein [Pseudonocardia sp.]
MRERNGGLARLPLVAALVAVACTVPATAYAAPSDGADAGTVLSIVNSERESAGCEAVSVDKDLTEAAEKHSADQAERGEMTHEGSDGSRTGERATRAGYSWSEIAENVAAGTRSGERAMELWMESSSHRKNIVNCDLTEMGVAEVDGYWTQVFATPR